MLGRLRMNVDECIDAYLKLSARVFQRKHLSPITMKGQTKARFSSEELEKAIKDVIGSCNLHEDALMKDTSPQACKVSVFLGRLPL